MAMVSERRRRLTREQQELVEANLNLAYYFARRIKAPLDLEQEDWEAECLLALVIAAESYDPAQGSLSNYVGVAVRTRRSHIINYYTQGKRTGKTVSFGGMEPFLASGTTAGHLVIVRDEQARCRNLVQCLPSPHREIITHRLEGKTFESIGASMGLTRERIRQLEFEAKRRMIRIDRVAQEKMQAARA